MDWTNPKNYSPLLFATPIENAKNSVLQLDNRFLCKNLCSRFLLVATRLVVTFITTLSLLAIYWTTTRDCHRKDVQIQKTAYYYILLLLTLLIACGSLITLLCLLLLLLLQQQHHMRARVRIRKRHQTLRERASAHSKGAAPTGPVGLGMKGRGVPFCRSKTTKTESFSPFLRCCINISCKPHSMTELSPSPAC